MLEFWLNEDNLEPFCQIVSGYCGYAFDEADWDAIAYAIQATDVEAGAWFEYPLVGTTTTQLHLARDPGTSIVIVKVFSDSEVEEQTKTLIDIAHRYRLAPW